jgi:hypothetical protein
VAVEHSGPDWLDTLGSIGGNLIGSYFGGPIGGKIGGHVGGSALMSVADLFDGNFDGLLADADPDGVLGGITGAGDGKNHFDGMTPSLQSFAGNSAGTVADENGYGWQDLLEMLSSE